MISDFDFLKESSIDDFERKDDIEENLCNRCSDIYCLEVKKPTQSCFVAVAVREEEHIKLKDGTIYYLLDQIGVELGYYDHLKNRWFLIGSKYRGYTVPAYQRVDGTGEKKYTDVAKDPVVGYRDALEYIKERYEDNTINFSDDDVIEDAGSMKICEWVEIDELSVTGKMLMKLK